MSSTPAVTIAANLRALREKQGLSVAALADRSGIARATLTKLEAGRGNPTIDTLYALADALGSALGDLIGARTTAPVEVIRAGGGTKVRGAVSARLLDRVHGHRLAELYDVDFATTARHADPHPAGVVESLLLTEGRLRVGPADAPVELSAGDFVRFPGDVPHLYEALGGPAHGVLVVSHP
ncbi:helix-turn-helix domain-containing protein [Actinocatenispora rupis]|nr:helix-turn-helix domain-containing protein [Actinocatenispora rupis]